jgi:hypothetical protein
MRFTDKEDIAAPVHFVFGELSDFEAYERLAIRAGAEVTRLDTLDAPTVGMLWEARAVIRGRRRKIVLELADFDPPHLLRFTARSEGFDARFTVETIALAQSRTRMLLDLDIKPRTLAARLALQPARMAKAALTRRFKGRARNHAAEIGRRYASPGATG